MRIEDLGQIDKAPQKGQYLIYTRTEVLFDSYSSIDEIKKMTSEKELLEVHLFDENKEYRSIVSQSRRFPAGMIEHVASFAIDDDTYRDECKLEDGGTIIVLNHLSYDDANRSQTTYIDDYRLVMGGK